MTGISPSLNAGVTTLLHTAQFGECTVAVSHDAVPGYQGTLLLRTATADNETCAINQVQAASVMDSALTLYKTRDDLAALESVSLGRVVVTLPWLSERLVFAASKDPAWDPQSGKPVRGTANQFVESVLDKNDALQPLLVILGRHGYKTGGTSCEKVLLNKQKLPYDAQCWIKLEAKKRAAH